MKKIFIIFLLTSLLLCFYNNAFAETKVYVNVMLAGATGGLIWFISYSIRLSEKPKETKYALLNIDNKKMKINFPDIDVQIDEEKSTEALNVSLNLLKYEF